jgi:hypothetical protein
MKGRHEGEHVGHLLGAFSLLDISSPLGPCKRVGDLDREDVWTQQLVNPLAEFVTDSDCFVIVRFGQHLFQGHVRVEDGALERLGLESVVDVGAVVEDPELLGPRLLEGGLGVEEQDVGLHPLGVEDAGGEP